MDSDGFAADDLPKRFPCLAPTMAGWFHLVSLRCLISFPEMLMRIVASDQNRERSTVVGRACINIFRDDYVRLATFR